MFDNLTPFEGRSYVDEGCSLSVMSYITFAVITANTVVNINDNLNTNDNNNNDRNNNNNNDNKNVNDNTGRTWMNFEFDMAKNDVDDDALDDAKNVTQSDDIDDDASEDDDFNLIRRLIEQPLGRGDVVKILLEKYFSQLQPKL